VKAIMDLGMPVIPEGWVEITGDTETKHGDKFYYPPSGNWIDYWFSPTGRRGTSLRTVKQFGRISIRFDGEIRMRKEGV